MSDTLKAVNSVKCIPDNDTLLAFHMLGGSPGEIIKFCSMNGSLIVSHIAALLLEATKAPSYRICRSKLTVFMHELPSLDNHDNFAMYGKIISLIAYRISLASSGDTTHNNQKDTDSIILQVINSHCFYSLKNANLWAQISVDISNKFTTALSLNLGRYQCMMESILLFEDTMLYIHRNGKTC